MRKLGLGIEIEYWTFVPKEKKDKKGDPVIKLDYPDGFLEYYDVERGETLAAKTLMDSGTCIFFLVNNKVVASNCNWGQEWYEYEEDYKFLRTIEILTVLLLSLKRI